ncbi:MAG: FMN-binding negative transcriptional regulator [Pseudomonadota bacterium]
MHPAKRFQTDTQAARSIVAQSPLATIAANGRDGPLVLMAPTVWNRDQAKLIGHVARSNSFWRELCGLSPMVSAVFRSDDAYVSASAYPSKAEHGRVVPTWNYIAAEARGRLTFKDDPVDIRASVAALSDHMEAERDIPWAITDAPDDYIERLSKAIVAFEIDVSLLKGVPKLSQDKSEEDRAGVVSDLIHHNARAERLTREMNLETKA